MISQALSALLERYGNELLGDHERFEVLLKHRCPQQSTESVLVASRLGLLGGLGQNGFPAQDRDRVVQTLRDWTQHTGGQSESAALEAATLWIDALNCPQLPAEQEEVVVTPAGPTWDEVAARLPNGGRVRLQAGSYRGQFQLPQARYELVGEGQVLWESPADGAAVKVEGGWLEARGIHWRGFGAVEVITGWAWLEDCKLEGDSERAWPRLSLGGKGAYGVLRRCQLIGPSESGVSAQQGSCLQLSDCQVRAHWDSLLELRGGCALVQRCQLMGPSPSGVVSFSADVYLQGCSIQDCDEALWTYGPKSKVAMSECELSGSAGDGVAIADGGQLVARGCGVIQNKGNGVKVGRRAMVTLEDCRVHGNGGFGVVSQAGARLELKGTSLKDNALGDRSENAE